MEKSPELYTENDQVHDLNRRELLKVLAAAGGGLAAAAFLPGKWLKPVVEAGVLPAHAQATETLTLVNLLVEEIPRRTNPNRRDAPWSGSVQYNDDLCKVGIESTQLIGSCPSLIDWSVSSPGGSCSGTFNFEFWAYCNEVLSVYLQVGSRQSNTQSEYLPCSYE